MKHTLAQKILQNHTDETIASDGQIVRCKLDMILANDITGQIAVKSFRAMGAKKVFDKDKIALVMDHFTPQKDIASANQVIVSRQFAQEQNITHYYEGADCGVHLAGHDGDNLVDGLATHAVDVHHRRHLELELVPQLEAYFVGLREEHVVLGKDHGA